MKFYLFFYGDLTSDDMVSDSQAYIYIYIFIYLNMHYL